MAARHAPVSPGPHRPRRSSGWQADATRGVSMDSPDLLAGAFPAPIGALGKRLDSALGQNPLVGGKP